MAKLLIFVGTYSTFIYSLLFDASTSSLNLLQQSNVGQAPSWVSFHPQNSSILYSTIDYSGQVSSFSVNKNTGALTRGATVSSGGQSAVHLLLSGNGDEIYVPNVRDFIHRVLLYASDRPTFSISAVPSMPFHCWQTDCASAHRVL